MWRVVCVGPSPLDKVRRVIDRGPLHSDKDRSSAIAAFLRATGLYESVSVVAANVDGAAVAAPDLEIKVDDIAPVAEPSIDRMSPLIAEQASLEPESPAAAT